MNKKRIVSILASACIISSFLTIDVKAADNNVDVATGTVAVTDNVETANNEDGTYKGFSYVMDGDEVTITSYDNSAKNVVIPNSINGYFVTKIAANAFLSCDMYSVAIPDGLNTIESQAFSSCNNLRKVTIPESVENIGENAFCSCQNLVEANVENNKISDYEFAGCGRLCKVNVNDHVEEIGMNAFEDCTSLKNIKIPESVSVIGDYVFRGCSKLCDVTINNNEISQGEFENCTGLTNTDISNNVCIVKNNAFSGCTNLVEVTIPSSVVSIEPCTFSDCSNLSNVTINNDEIADSEFSDCVRLSNVTISNNVKIIGESAFANCYNLSKLVIPASIKKIGINALENCDSLQDLYILNKYAGIDEAMYGNGYSRAIIHGYANSTANTFANNNNSEFVQFDKLAIVKHTVYKNEYNGSVKFTMFAQGEDNLKYRIIVMKDGVVVKSRGFGSNPSLLWKPKEYGEYTVIFKVKDSYGNIVKKTIRYTV